MFAGAVLGCSGDEGTTPAATDTSEGSADAADATTDAADDAADAGDGSGDDVAPDADDAGEDGDADEDADVGEDAGEDSTEDSATSDAGTDTGENTAPQVDCHDLSYDITCDKPDPDTNGYLACSDYFGDTTGVEVQCRAGVGVDVRNDPPCGSYEFYVGSCVYYTDALPTRCYVTHVGAISEDRVEPGRAFWRTACAGSWLEGE